jgi:hypothetical protein
MSQREWDDDSGGQGDEDEALSDPEGPQAGDLVGSRDSDDYAVVKCPHCGGEISELAEQCPHCGDWVVQDAGGSGRRRGVLIAIAILLVILLLVWVF